MNHYKINYSTLKKDTKMENSHVHGIEELILSQFPYYWKLLKDSCNANQLLNILLSSKKKKVLKFIWEHTKKISNSLNNLKLKLCESQYQTSGHNTGKL